jgi:hypothetical protein
MQAFEELVRDELAMKLASELRAQHPECCQGLSPQTLVSRARAAIGLAESRGMRTRYQIRVYAGLMLAIGPQFERYAKIRAFLTQDALPLDERIARMYEAMTDEDWELAASMGNDPGWPTLPERGEPT